MMYNKGLIGQHRVILVYDWWGELVTYGHVTTLRSARCDTVARNWVRATGLLRGGNPVKYYRAQKLWQGPSQSPRKNLYAVR